MANYYLEKSGSGLSSVMDKDGVNWIGFHNEEVFANKVQVTILIKAKKSLSVPVSHEILGAAQKPKG
ncbi:hypothetical protein [Aurantibacter sp.]|uniref:hypothetical protein n=1 Tax=Aurantibacter sp. TaxID=2807103 RepID=UPI0032644724